jgi:hypothetical protein
MAFTDSDLLSTARLSLQAAGLRDRAGWIGLFTPDGRIEDPVGSEPHIGCHQIGRFYDTFIGGRDISFDCNADFVAGSTVVRDVTLNVGMGRSVALSIPTILTYDVHTNGDDLKIIELQAYWELAPMMVTFARHGLAALPAGMELMRALLANQGGAGTAGFLRALRRPGGPGRALVDDLLRALCAGDELTTRRILGHASMNVELDHLGERLKGSRSHKVIVAGRSVAASLGSGPGAPGHAAVVIADLTDGPKVRRFRFFG